MFHVYDDDDGNHVVELDTDGIARLSEGLVILSDREPGQAISMQSLDTSDGEPTGVSEFILRRVQDE